MLSVFFVLSKIIRPNYLKKSSESFCQKIQFYKSSNLASNIKNTPTGYGVLLDQ